MKKIILSGLVLGTMMATAIANETPLLSDTIPYPYYDVQKASEGKSNDLMILNSGIVALEKRLEIISNAKKSIEVEYFIYATDTSSKIFTQELIKAAKRGVKVRILIDKSASVFAFDEYYATALMDAGIDKDGNKNIEVRYYNAAPLYQVSSINFRNHRKLVSVDDKHAITGGRNIEDDYYDFSEEFNFVDRDVYIKGPMALTMRKSFDEYFKSDIIEKVSKPKKPSATRIKRYKERGSAVWSKKVVPNTKKINEYNKLMKTATDFTIITDAEVSKRNDVGVIATKLLASKKMHSCPEMTYSTDRPGGNFIVRLKEAYSDDFRFLRKTLYDKMNAVDKKVTITSPYLINNGYSKELMDTMLSKDIEFDLYTNSLASTDAVYVAANLYKDAFVWAGMGMKIYIHKGQYIDESETLTPGVKDAKWGMHAKSHVYESEDYSEIMIGTYNIDNRSNHYNSEMAIFCKGNDELTQEMLTDVKHRTDEAYVLLANGKAEDKNGDEVNILGANTDDKWLMLLISAPSWLLKPLL
jgi:putative cardiolipin synthase